jgi:hypothetical protein
VGVAVGVAAVDVDGGVVAGACRLWPVTYSRTAATTITRTTTAMMDAVREVPLDMEGHRRGT